MDFGATRMGLVLTGGTIGSSEKDGLLLIDLTDSTVDSGIQMFAKAWRGPERLDLHTRTPIQKLSESVTPNDWLLVATAVRDLVENVGCQSVVILHGTDTAGYTSAALSFLLGDLDATIVVSGANLPMSDVNSDARTNVADAISVSRTLPRGVYFSFAGVPGGRSAVHLGTTVHKVKAEGQGYTSPNHGIIATVANGDLSSERNLPARSTESWVQAVSNDVVCVPLYPGVDLEMMSDALLRTGKKGAVVKLFTAATAPENDGRDSIQRFVERCTENKIVVVTCVEQFTTECSSYPSGVSARNAGALFAADIIPETAYVKLCWALGQERSIEGVRSAFMTPIAGESVVLDSTSASFTSRRSVPRGRSSARSTGIGDGASGGTLV